MGRQVLICNLQQTASSVKLILTPVTQEYEMIVEEGTRAEQLAKQQKNLKQRYRGNFGYAQYPSWQADASFVLQRCHFVASALLHACSP